MRHFLITGGGGYIGSVLVPRLLAENHRVTVVDRFYFGRDSLPQHPRLTCIVQDSRDMHEEQLKDVDTFIDLAAMSNDPCGEMFETLTWEVNYKARLRSAKLARKAGVQRYILPSSCSIYGFQLQQVNEKSLVKPLTAYAQANHRAEQDILALAGDDFCVTALRLSTVYGYSPRMRLDLVVNAMVYSAWKHGEIIVHGGGSQHRPLVHVKDVASSMAHVSTADKEVINGEIYNVGSSQLNLQISEVADMVKENFSQSGRRVSISNNGPQDLRSYNVSFEKIETQILWTAKKNIKHEVFSLKKRLDSQRIKIDERCYTINWYRKIFMEKSLSRTKSQ